MIKILIPLDGSESALEAVRFAIRLAQGESAGRALVEKALALNPRFDETSATEAKDLLAQPRSVSRR